MTILRDNELLLFGTVGRGVLPGADGFTAMEVVDALAQVGRSKDIVVRINSGGGFATEGIAIYNALESHRGKITTIIESVAASAASIIAMASDEIVMRQGAVMMVHDPSAVTMGTRADHAKSMEALEALSASMADIYAEATSRPVESIREEMKDEIWMTAREAVAKGYADKVEKGRAKQPTAFDYRVYHNAPEQMVALAQARSWSHDAETEESPSTDGRQTEKDTAMTDTPEKGPAEVEPAVTEQTETKPEMNPEPAVASAETPEQIEARVNARAADIMAACSLVGKPEKASEFIAKSISLSEVVAALQTERVSTAPEVSARKPNTDKAPAVIDYGQIYGQWNRSRA